MDSSAISNKDTEKGLSIIELKREKISPNIKHTNFWIFTAFYVTYTSMD